MKLSFIHPPARLYQRYRDLAPQLVPLDYTSKPDVKLPYQLIGSMPELKVHSASGPTLASWLKQRPLVRSLSPFYPSLYLSLIHLLTHQPALCCSCIIHLLLIVSSLGEFTCHQILSGPMKAKGPPASPGL